ALVRGAQHGPAPPPGAGPLGHERDPALRRSSRSPRPARSDPRALRLRLQGPPRPARADHQSSRPEAGRGGGAALRPARHHPGDRPAGGDPAPLGLLRAPPLDAPQGAPRARRSRGPRGPAAARPLLPRAPVPHGGHRGASVRVPVPELLPGGRPRALGGEGGEIPRCHHPRHLPRAREGGSSPPVPARGGRGRAGGREIPMREPAIPGALSAVDRLVVSLVAGINMRALYGAEHPALANHVERILEAVTAACEERQRDALTFLVVGQDLVVETQPLRTGSLYHQQFIRALTRRGVERLTLARGLDTEECVRFLTPMALGGVPISTRYITVGRIELQPSAVEEGPGPGTGSGGDPGTGPGGDSAVEALTAQGVDGARDAFTEFRTDRRGGLVRLEQVVWSLMDALQRATREILPLAP